jgi:DNA-binding response OmpR family regulator
VRRLSVLVVEDDVACQKMAAAPFRARGDYVRVAPDGFEALAMCLQEPPDVVLSDVQMPRMDGWQLLRMIRSRPQLADIPVIFTTTLNDETERLKGYQLGVDDYIGKPYRSGELRARVDRLAARSQPLRAKPVEKQSLRGDLTQVSVASVLSFLELEQKTGQLVVLKEGKNGRLFVQKGRPLRADLDDAVLGATPREQAFEILDWQQGEFEFQAGEIDGLDELKCTMTNLLLEHARVRDEEKQDITKETELPPPRDGSDEQI